MATISTANNEKIYGISKWGGLNEHPDGDTRLKMGEASVMENFKVTRDGNLKRRPGTKTIFGLCDEYTLTIADDNHTEALTTLSAGDALPIYSSASVSAQRGVVTLTGSSGSIEDGELNGNFGDILQGILAFDNDSATIDRGVLTIKNAPDVLSLQELIEALSALEEGQWLYLYWDEHPYAINAESLLPTSNGFILYGHRLTATPTTPAPVTGLWSGLVGGKEVLLASCGGLIWSLYDDDYDQFDLDQLGTIETSGRVTFFPFDGKVYILGGTDYYKYTGLALSSVSGYVPVIAINIGPVVQGSDSSESGETTGEYINRLTTERKVWLSPDGVGDTFQLPEVDLDNYSANNVIIVTDFNNNGAQLVEGTDYTVTAATGIIVFASSFVTNEATNRFEVTYKVKTSLRDDVVKNHFAEIFSGPTDNMVFIYGDGTNKALYSGMNSDGMPDAEYFPDQYEVLVGDSNTPITSMLRHYGDLVTYKTDSAWAITQSSLELATGDSTVAIYCTPVNRDKGNEAPGQPCLVNNNPVTCSNGELYHWINSSYYTSTLSRDERQARRISDRIQQSIKEMDLKNACMFDDNDGQEFYIVQNGTALVWNYAADVWYKYTGIDAVCMCCFHGEVLYGTSDGLIKRLTYESMGDDGDTIEAEWVSGAMDFGAGHSRKYSSSMWIGLKPEDGTSVDVSVETDRKDTFLEKIVASEKAKVKGQPFMTRTKIKAKKFVYYRLLLSVKDKQPAVTVTDAEFRVRETGYAK